MVALLISLKLRLLRNGLSGSVGQTLALVLGGLAAGSFTLIGVVGLIALRALDAGTAGTAVVVGGSLLVLGWTVLPVLLAGVDETLEPSRFALLPLRPRDLVPGLLLAGLVGLPGAASTVLGAATLVTWARDPLTLGLALPAAAIGVLTCVLASRLSTGLAAGLMAARRFREVSRGLVVLVLASAGLLPPLLGRFGGSGIDLSRWTGYLAWTPLGLPWAVPADAATGHPGRAAVRLLLATTLLVLGALLWSRLLDRALTDRAQALSGTRVGVRGALIDRLPDGPVWTVAGRSLRYWRRDPRYLQAAGGMLVATVVPTVAFGLGHGGAPILALGPWAGMLAGMIAPNDLGNDGSAFATHLLASVPGRVDRRGRALGVAIWAVPGVLVITVLAAVLSGRPELWPGVAGTALCLLLTGLGASAVAGALAPYPMPEAGGNPFRNSSGGSVRAMAAQAALFGSTVTIGVPTIALLVVAAVWWTPAAWIGLLLGPVLGAVVLWYGTDLGGRVIDSRGPEILASVRKPL